MASRQDRRGETVRLTPSSRLGRAEEWITNNRDVLIPVAVATAVFGFTVTRHALPSMVHDALSYTMAALRLVRDGIYAFAGGEPPGAAVPSDARVTPGYILFLSAFYGLFGRTGDPVTAIKAVHPLVTAVQFALAVASVGFLSLCGRELGGKRLALLTGLLGAVYLPFAWASTVALSESLAGPLLAAQLWWTLRLTRREASRTTGELLAFGAFSAAIVMVRPSMVLWVLLPLAYAAMFRLEPWKNLLKLALAAGLGFVLVFAPWWARNEVVLGLFVPLRTDLIRSPTGELASIGTEAPPSVDPRERPKMALLLSTTPWSAPDDVLWENAFHYDRTRVDFGRFPTKVHDGLAPFIRTMRYYQYFLLVAALATVLFVRRSPRLLIVASAPIYALAVHYNTQINPRYAFLGMPALIVLAGAGAYGLWHRFARRAGTP